jgi:hypothetical protein
MAATVYENLFDVEGDFFDADDHMDESVFTMLIDTPRPPDTVMAATVVEIPQAFEYDDPDFEEPDGVFFFAQGPPLPDDTGQTTVYYPDDPLDIEDDEAFGFEFFIVGTEAVQDPGGETIVYCPDDTLEPEEEDFGFPDLQIPSDDTGQTTAVFPDAEEPEDEDYGFSDLQVPPNFTPPDTGGEYVCLFPDQEDDLDDEDYGFADLQLPPDTQMSASLAQLDGQEADDPDDESYGHVDFQPPSDDTGELVCSYPDQAEEPEDEDYGFSDMQVPPNASVVETGGEYVCYFEDEAEEPEDEDFGFTAFTIPADTLMAASLVALDDQTPDEPDGEDFGFSDLQVPPNGTVITTRGNVVKGGIWQ